MFTSIGKTLKGLAKRTTGLGICLSVVVGLIEMDRGGWLIILIGVPAAWLVGAFLYGFGELIDCAQRIADKVDPLPKEVHHDGWTCPYCGEKNLLGEATCKKCGRS